MKRAKTIKAHIHCSTSHASWGQYGQHMSIPRARLTGRHQKTAAPPSKCTEWTPAPAAPPSISHRGLCVHTNSKHGQ